MRTIDIEMADGTAEARVVTGAGADPAPGVILYMDALGVRPALEQRAETIAAWGYTVLMPNTLYRSGTIAEVAPDRDITCWAGFAGFITERAKPRLASLDNEAMRRDVPRYLDALRGLDEVSPAPVAAVGYCMGGRMAMHTACADPHVGVAAAFHPGGLATGEPDEPIRDLRFAKAHFLFGYADADPSMDAEAIARVEAALERNSLRFEGGVYPGAVHGFAMTDAAPHDPAATERSLDALRRALRRID